MTSRLVLEYDGGGFAGWARQPEQRTVQEEVERALSTILGAPIAVVVAGRTDTGVHALGQVCSYEGEALDPRSLNALLPDDVAVLDCNPAAPGFDARRDATSRAYCYRVLARRARSAMLAGRVLWWPRQVSFSDLEECASALVGVHDFTAFTPTETDHVHFSREVFSASWRRSPETPELIEFWIEADAFMRHMNRVLVGTMLEVAAGRRTVGSFASLLEGPTRSQAGPPRSQAGPTRSQAGPTRSQAGPTRSQAGPTRSQAGPTRSQAGPTAPPWGLYLAGVGYGGERVLGV